MSQPTAGLLHSVPPFWKSQLLDKEFRNTVWYRNLACSLIKTLIFFPTWLKSIPLSLNAHLTLKKKKSHFSPWCFSPLSLWFWKHSGVNLSKTSGIWNICWITVGNYRNRITSRESQGKLDIFQYFLIGNAANALGISLLKLLCNSPDITSHCFPLNLYLFKEHFNIGPDYEY